MHNKSSVNENELTNNSAEDVGNGRGSVEPENDAANLGVVNESQANSTNQNSMPMSDVKTDVATCFFGIHAGNSSDIDNVLEEPVEIDCGEDVIMKVGRFGIPKPWSVTSDRLVKRESDVMSGDIPFNQTVNIINTLAKIYIYY